MPAGTGRVNPAGVTQTTQDRGLKTSDGSSAHGSGRRVRTAALEPPSAQARRSTPVAHRLLLALSLLLCAASATAEPLLRVATSGDYAPFSIENAEGDVSGFDLAVANRLAEDLGRSLDVQIFKWPELNAQLRKGDMDVAMSGVTVRADRALYAQFSRPYAVTGAVAVIRNGDRQRYTNLEALNQEGLRIGVNGGGHLEQVARRQFPQARLVLLSNNRLLPDLLRQMAVQAVVSEQFEARTWGDDLVVLGPFTRDRKAYAVPRAKAALLNELNRWLAAREADGWLNQQREQWLGKSALWTETQANLEAVIGAIDLRLQLMPLVAAAKQRENLPVQDPAQEQKVLASVREQAREAGLDPEPVAELFRVQIGLARGIQEAAPQTKLPDGTSLAEIRPAVAAASAALINELQRSVGLFGQPAIQRQLAADLRVGVTAAGVPPSAAGALATALTKIRPLPKSQSRKPSH